AVALAIGMGGDARRALAEHRPSFVVSCGFAGGLDPALSTGDLVLATGVRNASGALLAAPEAPRKVAAAALEGSRLLQGELLCPPTVAGAAGENRAHGGPGARAVDMKSYGVAQGASEAGVPWVALRAILDPVDSALPAFAREARRSYLWPALK